MNNPDKLGLPKLPLCNNHIHPTQRIPIESTVRVLNTIMDYFGYERITLCSLLRDSKKNIDPSNNLKAFYCKSRLNTPQAPNRVYAYANIMHHYDGLDTSDGYLRQVKQLYAMGADGYKILDGKPLLRRYLGKRLDDPIFDEMYSFIEKMELPITYHVGDPPEFWDIDKIPKWALDREWFWGKDGYTSLEDLRDEIDGILAKHPKLKLCLAHFYFLGHDIDAATEFMEKWENTAFDVTPGGEMFVGFSKRHDEWREFFLKYADRIYLGTDTYNFDYGDDLDAYEKYVGYPIGLIRTNFETSEPYTDKKYGPLVPLNLDEETYMKIYHDNFVRLHGDARKINSFMAAQNAADILTELEHKFISTETEDTNNLEMNNLRVMYKHFSNI